METFLILMKAVVAAHLEAWSLEGVWWKSESGGIWLRGEFRMMASASCEWGVVCFWLSFKILGNMAISFSTLQYIRVRGELSFGDLKFWIQAYCISPYAVWRCMMWTSMKDWGLVVLTWEMPAVAGSWQVPWKTSPVTGQIGVDILHHLVCSVTNRKL